MKPLLFLHKLHAYRGVHLHWGGIHVQTDSVDNPNTDSGVRWLRPRSRQPIGRRETGKDQIWLNGIVHPHSRGGRSWLVLDQPPILGGTHESDTHLAMVTNPHLFSLTNSAIGSLISASLCHCQASPGIWQWQWCNACTADVMRWKAWLIRLQSPKLFKEWCFLVDEMFVYQFRFGDVLDGLDLCLTEVNVNHFQAYFDHGFTKWWRR